MAKGQQIPLFGGQDEPVAPGPVYPDGPGHVAGSATSAAAAASVARPARTVRELVLAHVRRCGAHGCTDEELDAALEQPRTVRPRRCELLAQGKVRDSGRRRPSLQSGRQMTVWVAV